MTTTAALWTRTRLSETICCSPPDSIPARSFQRLARNGNSDAARSRISRRSWRDAPRSPTTRFSATVRPGEQRPALGDEDQPAAGAGVPRQRCHVLAVEEHRPGACLDDTGDRRRQRGLPGAVGTEDRADGAGGHLERHVAQGPQRAVGVADVLEPEGGRA